MTTSSKTFAHLRVDGLSKAYAGRPILTDISFAVPHDDRVGIIGDNGSGKTTLLRLLAGQLEPDAGVIETHAGHELIIGLLPQEPQFAAYMTVTDVLEDAVKRFRQAETDVHAAAQQLAQAPDRDTTMARYTHTLETAERLGVWQTDSRIESTMAGLGLRALDRTSPVTALSGGQRARLSLARLLLEAPDVLLLDEPTNHLDDAARAYLRDVITHWWGPVVLVSHDREFLDATVVSLIDLDPAPRPHAARATDEDLETIGITRFTGTYTDYVAAQTDARRRWQAQYDHEQAELRRLRASVSDNQVVGHADWKPRTEVRMAQKYYADRNAKVVARRVNDARSRFETLEATQVVKPPAQLTFQGLDAAVDANHTQPAAQETILHADAIAVDDRLAPISIALHRRDALLITGANGAGKSTLLHVVAGHLTPDQGVVHRSAGVRVGLLPQETSWGELKHASARSVYAELVGASRAETFPLATFQLFHPTDERRAVGTLSIGQQRRLALAILLADPPDVLLLDEPTNHLSLRLASELEASLPQYPGAVVVASHDRWLRDRWQGQRVHLGA